MSAKLKQQAAALVVDDVDSGPNKSTCTKKLIEKLVVIDFASSRNHVD